MVVDRSGLPAVPLNRSGLSVDRRFAFYDQGNPTSTYSTRGNPFLVHTIGTDIKHAIDACAAVTLGKDMTFRDFKQGCWRMRDIAKGQTIRVLVIPEILQLIKNITNCGSEPSLDDVCCWLMWNSLESEQMQYAQVNVITVLASRFYGAPRSPPHPTALLDYWLPRALRLVQPQPHVLTIDSSWLNKIFHTIGENKHGRYF